MFTFEWPCIHFSYFFLHILQHVCTHTYNWKPMHLHFFSFYIFTFAWSWLGFQPSGRNTYIYNTDAICLLLPIFVHIVNRSTLAIATIKHVTLALFGVINVGDHQWARHLEKYCVGTFSGVAMWGWPPHPLTTSPNQREVSNPPSNLNPNASNPSCSGMNRSVRGVVVGE